MLRIVMDGAGDMPPSWSSEYQIDVIPINIQFGGKTYLQGVDLTNEDFYELVDREKAVPKTSQPSPQQFVEFYKRIAKPGERVLSLHVTKNLSGTYDSAELASRELKGQYLIVPFDSGCGSAGMGFMCKEARIMDEKGIPFEDIIKHLEYIRESIRVILTLDTLEYARMSGRVKALQAALVSLLDVKPIVELKDGVLDMAGRVRTRKRALQQVIDRTVNEMRDRPVNVAVVNARDEKVGEALVEKVCKVLNCNELIATDLSIAVAANLGPGTVGIVSYPIANGGS